MNSKSFFLALSMSLFVCSPKAHSVVDFSKYTPTLDKDPNAEIESAYLLSYTKTTEDNADFSTYEKDAKGQWQKVFYKYDVTYDTSKNSKAVEFYEGDNQEKVIGHYFEMEDIVSGDGNPNYGNVIINNAEIDKIEGDFIANVADSVDYHSSATAIYNTNTITKVTGDFIKNTTKGNFNINGGAIYNGNGEDYVEYNKLIGTINGNFIGNAVESNRSLAAGGAIYNAGTIQNINGTFINNHAITYEYYYAQGGAVYNFGSAIINSLKSDFIGNYVYSTGGSKGGAIYNNNSGNIENIAGDFIRNYVSGKGDFSNVYGGAIYYDTSNVIHSIKGNFIGNYAQYQGNDITSQVFGGAIYNSSGSAINNISGDFVGNYAKGEFSSPAESVVNVSGGAIYNAGTIGLTTTADKRNILIENNRIITKYGAEDEEVALNFMDMVTSTLTIIQKSETDETVTEAVTNIHTIENSYINIRDPFRSVVSYTRIDNDEGTFDSGSYVGGTYGQINKTGAGSLYLWGDNSEFRGKIDINEGDFIAMFEEAEDLINDPLGQRRSFDLSNATINFAEGTTFRPMVTDSKIATLGSAVTVDDNVALRPYNVSALSAGEHTYKGVNYSKFVGTKTDLLEVDTSSSAQTKVSVKNLSGYEGLSGAVDGYRKLSSLSMEERIIFDNIYYTGNVPSNIKDDFKEVIKVISGEDKIIINEVHKASVRQFSRQIYSRIQNKNCPSCGMLEGYSDDHLWVNVGKNFVDKDTNGDNVGYKYSPTSLAIGYDHDIIPNALNMGVAFSYAFGDVKGKGKSIYNTAEIDEYMLSLYWKYKPVRAYMTGSIGGGYMTNNSKVRGASIDVRGDSDTKVGFINTEFGYDFGNACGVLEPFVGFEYAYIYNGAYTEKGLGARHFGSNDYNSIELPIGFRVSRNMAVDSYIVTPSIELAYSRSLGDRSSEVNSYFVGSPESPWVMRGANDSRDSLRSSLNLKVNNIYSPFALNFGYARDTRSDYSDDQLYLTVRYNF